ncbi:MAG: 16S rRNA (guanine(527)-N(7))-methyltransferase RsmG [Actinomycetota bacterium]|nr:16S rRNA (guanine(527)-N(7))-methyltransferase RsmG [Actinomycetota bacterium]
MEQPALPSWLEPHRADLQAYADLLTTVGVDHGLIGPREIPRLWSRHLLNSAVVAEPAAGLVRQQAIVADVGSGAGLPGLVWALVRPDLRITLIEPLLRRAKFLQEAVEELGLTARVVVLRGRGEEVKAQWASFDVVTARAVAPLPKLLGWTVPLLKTNGRLLALKGQQAAEELQEAGAVIAKYRLREVSVIHIGEPWVDPATTVVSAYRGTAQ